MIELRKEAEMFSFLSDINVTDLLFEKIVFFIVLITAFPIHEFAHAFVAYKLGDGTARWQGRLTLNPFKHLDLMGTLCMLVAGIGWAKPVPVNPLNFKNRKLGMALTSLAGPVSNVIIAAVAMIICKLLGYSGLYYQNEFFYFLLMMFDTICWVNLSLAVFNMIPIPPFDGSRILFYFLPDKYYFMIMQYEQYIMIGLLVILWTGVLDVPLSIVSDLLYSLVDKLTFFIDIIAKLVF